MATEIRNCRSYNLQLQITLINWTCFFVADQSKQRNVSFCFKIIHYLMSCNGSVAVNKITVADKVFTPEIDFPAHITIFRLTNHRSQPRITDHSRVQCSLMCHSEVWGLITNCNCEFLSSRTTQADSRSALTATTHTSILNTIGFKITKTTVEI